MATKKDRVEELLAEMEGVTNETLKAALEEELAEAQEAKKVELKRQFKQARTILSDHVEQLRQYRKLADDKKKEITIIDNAFEQFKKDGDWSNFMKAYHSF